jgi:hypothetical protein
MVQQAIQEGGDGRGVPEQLAPVLDGAVGGATARSRSGLLLFDDPILANSALDRFAHWAHQIVMEGPSLRAVRAPRPAKGGRRPGEKAGSGE